jgi:hypothetical protein
LLVDRYRLLDLCIWAKDKPVHTWFVHQKLGDVLKVFVPCSPTSSVEHWTGRTDWWVYVSLASVDELYEFIKSGSTAKRSLRDDPDDYGKVYCGITPKHAVL